MEKTLPSTIDEYIAGCPEQVQPRLQALRRTIAEAAPEAKEKISWGMATFVLHGNLVHFSAEKKHIGFHPTPSAILAFHDALLGFSCSKGTVRFPNDQPLPLQLIAEMVRFRAAEQQRLAEEKKTGKKVLRPLRSRYEMPEDVAEVLASKALDAAYAARPPYQQNDYIGWITRAKRAETRDKRLRQMLDELQAGNAYMGLAYAPKNSGKEKT